MFQSTVRYIRFHKVSSAVILFLILMGIIHYIKPTCIYNQEGGFRPFGLGYRHKTVLPIWLVSILLGLLSYLLILVLLSFPIVLIP